MDGHVFILSRFAHDTRNPSLDCLHTLPLHWFYGPLANQEGEMLGVCWNLVAVH